MASIKKRNKSYAVVYNYVDENGKTKQKWETCKTHKEAKNRKSEIENQLNKGDFVLPTKFTVSEFMDDFITLYGEKQWGPSMYDACCAMIGNYVKPIIGDMEVQSITPRIVDKYIQQLQKTPPVVTQFRKAQTQYVTPSTIEKVIKLLRHAFKQAIRWELISRNPFNGAVLPKVEHETRDIWTNETIKKALDECSDSKLYIAINLAFACSLRVGEIVGLTWNNVDISDKAIANDDAYIKVETELLRVPVKTMETLNYRGIKFVFPPKLENPATRLVLKEPKTKSSVRKIWLPKTLAYILLDWKKSQENMKEVLGNEYQDYNLVVPLPDGNPCENRVMTKAFTRLKKSANLPNVVFHSLRHSSTTYKLKLNNGDIKATQGDTGHASVEMVTKVYAHILDEDRKMNAQKFENDFYSTSNLGDVRLLKEQNDNNSEISHLIEQLQKSPELVATLTGLLNKSK